MQRVSRALMSLAVVMAAATPAAAGGLPYCIKGCDFGGGAGDCSFSSLAQCQATASGRDATCAANPYLDARAEISKAEMPANLTRISRRKL